MDEARKCPKCGGEMEAGKLFAKWTIARDLELFFKNEKKKLIVTYACQICGYVENYLAS